MSRRRPPTSRSRRAPSRGSGKLRIIGGQFRRRQLPVIDSPGLRPTPDRVRETLFNWLTFDLAGRRVLDLFAGTGALGLEALSRGAKQALFVEADHRVALGIENNLNTLGAAGQVVKAEVTRFLDHTATPYDVVFLDPPFRHGLIDSVCTRLETQGWLNDNAWIYLEHEAGLRPEVPDNWLPHREVKAGDSLGRLYRRAASPAGDAC